MTGEKKRTRVEILGDLVREASILIFVFGMLDVFFNQPSIPESVEVPAWAAPIASAVGQLVLDSPSRRICVLPWVIFVCLSSGLTLAVGMRCEFPKQERRTHK